MASDSYVALTKSPVQALIQAQLDAFTHESIRAIELASFDGKKALMTLRDKEGARVIGADFGGDKGQTQLFVIKNGQLEIDDSYTDYVQGSHGDGYLASLEKTAAFAREHNVPVGISWGAPIEGTRPLFHPKAVHFLDELKQKYDGDIANVIPELASCTNDGPAGLIDGIIEANRIQSTDAVLFVINGGGLGMAAYVNDCLYSTEAGHVEGARELNVYSQTEACGVFGAEYVCVERLGANKAGIEAQWEAQHGYMRARDIEDQYKAGNIFAGELYDHSAWVLAHMIQGEAKVLGIDLGNETTAIVGHGGAFKFPHYGERVQQILSQHNGTSPRLLMTKDYGNSATNACLDGAALAAIIA